ncbi:MAG: hypothetical protein WCP35_04240 [Verrucomicrobiota bacterium]
MNRLYITGKTATVTYGTTYYYVVFAIAGGLDTANSNGGFVRVKVSR